MIVPLWVCVAFFHKKERKEEIDRERVKERPIYGRPRAPKCFISFPCDRHRG